MNIDLDAERKALGAIELEIGTKLKDKATGEVWTIIERGGFHAEDIDTGKILFVRVVGGQPRQCFYVYDCVNGKGEQKHLYGDEAEIDFETVS